VYQLGSDYAIFIPVIKRILARQTSSASDASTSNSPSSAIGGGELRETFEYAALVTKLLKNQPIRESDLPRFTELPATTATSSTAPGSGSSSVATSEREHESSAHSDSASAPASEASANASASASARWELRVNEVALRKAWKTRKQATKAPPISSLTYSLPLTHSFSS
jgi:hypothetical protein